VDHHTTSIALIGASPNIAGGLQSIDSNSQGAACQPHRLTEPAGGDGSESREVIQAAQVGAVHVKVVGDGSVEQIARGRERAQPIEDRLMTGRGA